MRKTSFLCMVLFVNLMDTNLFVLGETITITATSGQNVSLPCTNGNMNDANVVRWFTREVYISADKMIDESSLGLQAPYFAIPGGEDADYSLFIKVPDNIDVWEFLEETYECRLTPMSGDYSILSTVTLNIYQSLPKCTSLHINDTTSIASCSYNIPSEMESLIWRSNGMNLNTINCLSSNVCTLTYTYNPADIVPHGITCAVNVSGMISVSKLCSINEMSFATSTGGTKMDRSFPRSTTSVSFTETTSNSETSSIRNTPPTTMFQTSPITTKETVSTTENPDQSTKVETSFSTTEYIDKGTITELPVNQTSIMPTTSTEFATNEQINSTENPDFPIHPIAIMSVAFVIILLLIIFIIYFVRRCSQYKQNPSFKSAPQDDHEYVEVDFKVNSTTKGKNQEILENSKESVMEENWIYESADMNGKQNDANKQKNGENQEILENSKESVMEENQIYQSADMNGKQINDDGNVAKKQKMEIKKKGASENSNEDGTNDIIVYHENEAYESLNDININNAKLDQKESGKKGTKIPAYVHYEVLERE
ncbi:uncharacterized protein [Antedon mediterranea]|uniref:uncharacterized protein n=1 Tax=Antedon mediterranea TaxID=105859 RepID=UPI003AF75DA1